MKISELITKLEETQAKEGDLKVCVAESHEYWGEVYRELRGDIRVDPSAQPEGPKSGKSEKAIVFSYSL